MFSEQKFQNLNSLLHFPSLRKGMKRSTNSEAFIQTLGLKKKVFLLSSFIKFRLLIELKYQYLKNLFLSFRIDKEKCKFYHSIHLKVLNLTQFRSITQQKMSNQDSIY